MLKGFVLCQLAFIAPGFKQVHFHFSLCLLKLQLKASFLAVSTKICGKRLVPLYLNKLLELHFIILFCLTEWNSQIANKLRLPSK